MRRCAHGNCDAVHTRIQATQSYFEGALDRAKRPRPHATATPVASPAPLVSAAADSPTRAERLARLESAILAVFERVGKTRLLTTDLFDALPHAHADVVRALEEMEKQRRLLVRQTEEGNDWLLLTEEGARAARLTDVPHTHATAIPDPPKSAR